MALGGLGPLDPNALAATKLKSGGLTAQEVAYKRKAMEDQMGAQNLTAEVKNKATDQKAMEALAKIPLEPTPGTLQLQHTKFALDWNESEKRTRAAEEKAWRAAGSPPADNPNIRSTPAGQARWGRAIEWNQMVSNSKQMQAMSDGWQQQIAANPDFYPKDAKRKIDEWYRSTEPLTTGEVIDMPKELFDFNAAVASTFGKMQKEIEAYASPDGTRSGSDAYIPSEMFKKVAETFVASDRNVRESADEAFDNYPKEKQEWILKSAENWKMTPAAVISMDLARGLYDRHQRTAVSEQQNEAGYGQKKEEIGAINFIEKGIGMNDPSNAGKTLKEMGYRDYKTVNAFLAANPTLGRFSVNVPKNAEVFSGYNGMIYKQTEADGKKINRYIGGIIRDPSTGKTQVVTTDASGNKLKISKPISSERFYSEVMDPLAEYNPELDHKAVGYVYQKKYGPIEGQEGNISLPRKGGALNLTEAEAMELD